MKKNKIITIAVAAIASLTLITGASFAWFTSSAVSMPININTGSVQVNSVKLTTAALTGILPGQTVRLNNTDFVGNGPIEFTNTGSIKAILKVNFDLNGQLAHKGDTLPDGEHSPSHYVKEGTGADAIWKFSPERLSDVIELKVMDANNNIIDNTGTIFKKIGDSYYALINFGDSNKATFGFVDTYIKPEFGGGSLQTDGTLSPNVMIEHSAKFNVGYTVTAVQNTSQAIKEIFGETVLTQLPANWLDAQ